MIKQYPEVFYEELGIMNGVKGHIQVPEGAISRYFKPRSLAKTLQGPVAREIERLQTTGTIDPMTHSLWAAIVVLIVKMNERIQI